MNSFVNLQANLQSKIRGGTWWSRAFKSHSEETRWAFKAGQSKDRIRAALLQACEELDDFHLKKDGGNMLVFNYITPGAKWQDEISIILDDKKASILCCSLGLFPMSIPGAPFLNAIFFWVPFGDNGKNAHEHALLKKKVAQIIESELDASVKRYSSTNPKNPTKKQSD